MDMKKRRFCSVLIIFLFLANCYPLQGKGSPHKWVSHTNMHLQGNKMMKKIGSRPPKCEHRCGKCKPCKAIQVPTTSDRFGLLYANYEPEGWKCKCGSAFFNP